MKTRTPPLVLMVKTMVSRFSGKNNPMIFYMGIPHFLIQVIGFSYWNPWWRLGTAVRLASSCRWIQCSSYPRCTAPSRADAPSGSPQSSTTSTTSRFLKMPKICKYCSILLFSLLLPILLLILSKFTHVLHPNHSHTGFCLGSEICVFCNTFATRTNLSGCSNQVNPEAIKHFYTVGWVSPAHWISPVHFCFFGLAFDALHFTVPTWWFQEISKNTDKSERKSSSHM